MIEINQIIIDLEAIKRNPKMFIEPVTPEILFCYLTGFKRGIFLSQRELTFHDFVEAHRFAVQVRGLSFSAAPSYFGLREKGITEDEIIQEMIEIEIEKYRILSQQTS